MLKLETELRNISGIAPKFLRHLDRMGIKTVRNLVFHFPFRYEDFSQIYKIEELEPGQQATVQGVVQEVSARRSWQRRMAIVEALIQDESASIRAVWFNQPFVKNAVRPGRLMNFAGKVSVSEGEIYLSNPTYEPINLRRKVGAPTQWASEETAHTGRLVPIYPETRGLTSKGLRYLIQPILKNMEPLEEWMPEEILEKEDFPEINKAIRTIHFPEYIEDTATAKKRFAFEDLFLLQLLNFQQKLALAREKAPSIATDIETLKKIIATLPFKLTVSQKKSLWEILQDIQKPSPMNRLLQGDVGSGKTVIAALAAISAAMNGFQTAFMAPTEVLAHQHFETLKKITSRIPEEISGIHIKIGFLASGGARFFMGAGLESEVKKKSFLESAARGEVQITIGTHALIQQSVNFAKLGLVIVDEQHRFGVKQRAELVRRQTQTDAERTRNNPRLSLPAGRQARNDSRKSASTIPHFLSMSATPIPRTLMLTIFGDLDISTIDELPSGRKKIITTIVPPEKRPDAYAFIRKEIREGRQAFVICPRIEPQTDADLTQNHAENFPRKSAYDPRKSALLEVKSVKEEFDKLSERVFPDLKVAMLHGQMPARGGSAFGGKPGKESVMKAFQNKEIDILVSTSVIEVGVDVPNATVMMIEGSERFGLAQLYQFRGRVGRGEHQSHCFLFTDSESKQTQERMKAVLEAKNGFELAEKDLEIRGPGQFLGTEQTGLPDLAMRGLQNVELIKTSRAAAEKIAARDRSLAAYPLLKKKLREFKLAIHPE